MVGLFFCVSETLFHTMVTFLYGFLDGMMTESLGNQPIFWLTQK